MVETTEFHISKSHGLVGLDFKDVGGKFTLAAILEPCLAAYLGLVEVGDVLVAIDGKDVTCEADLVPPVDELGASFSKDDMSLKIERQGKSTQYDIEGDDIKRARSLAKSTSKTDHATQATLRLQMGEVLLARGDYAQAQEILEDGLNIAYGINIGTNAHVVTAYSSLSQVYYCQGNFTGAAEALNEAEEVLKKLGASQDNLVLELEVVNKKAEVAICLEEEEEMLKLKARAAEILKIILSLQVGVHVHVVWLSSQ
jgi:tetratricopeptide (TPR) repeat protein